MFRDMAEGITKECVGVCVCSAFKMNKKKIQNHAVVVFVVALQSTRLRPQPQDCGPEHLHLIQAYNMERHHDPIPHQAAFATRLPFPPPLPAGKPRKKKGVGGCNFTKL